MKIGIGKLINRKQAAKLCLEIIIAAPKGLVLCLDLLLPKLLLDLNKGKRKKKRKKKKKRES
jgi:hypothetical protein